MHPKMKIIISLAIVFSILLIFLPQTSFFKNLVENATTRQIVIFSIIAIVLGLGRGILLMTNKELKKEKSPLIKIKVLINPFLIVFLTLVLLLSSLYLHLNPDVEFVLFTLIPLSVLVSGVIAVIWLIRWMKNKNKTTSNHPNGGA